VPRSVIEDQLRLAVLTAMPLPDMALEAVVAGIALLTGENTSAGDSPLDIAWGPENLNPGGEDGRGWL
jgi:hypothetical protein